MSGFYGYSGGNDGGYYTSIANAKKAHKKYLATHTNSSMSFAHFKKTNYRKPVGRKRVAKKTGVRRTTVAKRSAYNRFIKGQPLVYSRSHLRKLFNAEYKPTKRVSRKPRVRRGTNKSTATKRAAYSEFTGKQPKIYSRSYLRKLFNASVKAEKEVAKALLKAKRAEAKLAKAQKKGGSFY